MSVVTTLLVARPPQAAAPAPAADREEAPFSSEQQAGEEKPAASCSGQEALHLYTRESLASTLCLMGAKPRHSVKVAARVFEALTVLSRRSTPGLGGARVLPPRLPRLVAREAAFDGAAATLPRPHFEALVAWALAEYAYAKPDQADDLRLACRVNERKMSLLVVLCGTSGTGKSTLASLLAARMGITTVISTDTVRGVMRSVMSETACPVLFASTYDAGDHIDYPGEPGAEPAILERKRTVKGYKAQSELVMAHLARLLATCEARGESAIVEGVHLNLGLVLPLMERHPSMVPFLVTINNEDKHRERFAVRAKYMSLAPEANRYIRYFRQIRTIQDYLAVRAGRFLVPVVNNTNVDRSVQTIHATAFGYLRRSQEAPQAQAERAAMLYDEYRKHTLARGAWSSKSMLAVIRGRHGQEQAAGTAEEEAEGAVPPLPPPFTAAPALAGASSCDDSAPALAHVAGSDGGASVHESSAVSEDGEERDVRFSRLATLDEAEDSPRCNGAPRLR